MWKVSREWVPYQEALSVVLSRIREVSCEEVDVTECVGRFLCKDLVSAVDSPPFDRAAMDGYAVVAEDTYGAREDKPVRLKLVGEVYAGSADKLRVAKGEAVAIATGAVLPQGATAVVRCEDAREKGKLVEVLKPAYAGQHVSRRGEDIRSGETLLRRGSRVRSIDLAAIISSGVSKVAVYRKPRVSIVAVGDEVIPAGTDLKLGEIWDSNSPMIKWMCTQLGSVGKLVARVGDDPEEIRQAIANGAKAGDLVVLIGGSSVGKRDLVPDIISSVGELLFSGVAISPGGPVSFGLAYGKPVFSLPGFPVGAFTAFEALVAPAILKMVGYSGEFRPVVYCKLRRAVRGRDGRRTYVRVKVVEGEGMPEAEPIMAGGSGLTATLLRADGYVVVEEDVEGFSSGEVVPVRLLCTIWG